MSPAWFIFDLLHKRAPFLSNFEKKIKNHNKNQIFHSNIFIYLLKRGSQTASDHPLSDGDQWWMAK